MALPPIVLKIRDRVAENPADLSEYPSMTMAAIAIGETIRAQTEEKGKIVTPSPLGEPTPQDYQRAAKFLATPEGAAFLAAAASEGDTAAPGKGQPHMKTLAQRQQEYAEAKAGPGTWPFLIGDETLYVRRFSAAEVLHLSLLMPLDNDGFIAPERVEQIELLAAEILRLGLAKDVHGTRYFEPSDDVIAFASNPVNEPFVAECLIAIDAHTRILPRRPAEETPANVSAVGESPGDGEVSQ